MDIRRKPRRSLSLRKQALAALLFLVMPGLSTLAKSNDYLPPSNPGHYLTIATKLKVAAPVAIVHELLQASPELIPPQLHAKTILHERQEPATVWLGLPVFLLRRPPPPAFA